MQTDRAATLFNLRYAVRVLERHARLWRRIDGAVRLVALLAGSGAIGAIGAENSKIAIALGAVFALFQAIEFALRPAEIAARSMSQRREYASVFAKERSFDDATLAEAYADMVAADDIIVSESLRHLAYNDVVLERGLDPAACYEPTARLKLAALFA